MKCVGLIASGKVQGVFFRKNTRRKAVELGLTGFVRNLDDGTVEVIAQGDEEKVNELVEFIKKGPGSAKVINVKLIQKNAEKFINFEIR